MRQVAIGLFPILQGTPPEGALLGIAAAESQNDGQGDLAVMKIVADGFSQIRLGGGVVENIVDKLEGDAEIEAETVQRLFLSLRPVRHHGADAAGGGEQRRGLAADDLEIGLLAGLGVVAGDELEHLALGDDG